MDALDDALRARIDEPAGSNTASQRGDSPTDVASASDR